MHLFALANKKADVKTELIAVTNLTADEFSKLYDTTQD